MNMSRSMLKSGGGFVTGPGSVAPGYAEITPYSGAGKDCPADLPMHRPGEITSYTAKGLPGMSGGRRRRTRRRSGGAPLAIAGEFGAPYQASNPLPSTAPGQTGGAYNTVLSGPLAPNGVGGSAPAGVERIPCATRYPPQTGGFAAPRIEVGAASDMAVYHAQNAGYTNQAVSVPGAAPIMAQVGYPAGGFNPACIKTGGGLNLESSPLAPVSMKDLGDRYDFDGTHGGLPVRFGGRRRSSKRGHSKRRHSKRRHSKRRHSKRRHSKRRHSKRKN